MPAGKASRPKQRRGARGTDAGPPSPEYPPSHVSGGKAPGSPPRSFGVQPIAEQRKDASRERIAVCVEAVPIRERARTVLAESTSARPVVVSVDAVAERLGRRRDAATLVDLPVLDALVEHPALGAAPAGWAASVLLIVDGAPHRRLRSALRAGVGALLEADRLDSLPAVIDVLRAGHLCVPGVLRRPLSRAVLSQRERQTLALAFTGLTNAEIGARLFVAPSTVKTHLSAAFQKLGVHSRSEAAALLHDPEEGLMELVLGSPLTPAGTGLADGPRRLRHRTGATAARERRAPATSSAIGTRSWSR
jgi:DNA-binding NarL/FixJ family response regulator